MTRKTHFNQCFGQKKTHDDVSNHQKISTVIKNTGLFFLLSMNSFSNSSFAEDFNPITESECTSTDLRNDFHLKMRNQQETSWCFAHAASDLLQFNYRVPVQISAADIAINYSQTNISKLIHFFKKAFGSKNPTPAETGFIKIAVEKIIPQGYCPESALPSDLWTREDSHGNESEVEITEAIAQTLDLQKRIHNGNFRSADELPWYFKFKNISKQTFFSILNGTSQKRVFGKIRESACRNERSPFQNVVSTPSFSIKSKKAMNSIHRSLSLHKPVTIDFFSDVLRHYEKPKKRISELHTVLIYARKYSHQSGECMLLIKDSYGEQCEKYDPVIECELGNVWLSESKIFNSMTSTLKID